jgi:hypothetical protein
VTTVDPVVAVDVDVPALPPLVEVLPLLLPVLKPFWLVLSDEPQPLRMMAAIRTDLRRANIATPSPFSPPQGMIRLRPK